MLTVKEKAINTTCENYEAIKTLLEEAKKELELAEIDHDHAGWYMNELENSYAIYEDYATEQKLDKACIDFNKSLKAYNASMEKCERLEEMLNTLKDIETELYFINDIEE